jgi:hypothetical protein
MTGSSTSNAAADQAGGVAHDKPRDYEVGYGRPPIEHRFKPGNHANPKGRKKKTRNRKVVISEILLEPITVKEGGEVKKMSMLEAVLKKTIVQGACRGQQGRSDYHRHRPTRRHPHARTRGDNR